MSFTLFVKSSMALGNMKPASLLRFEKALWIVLIDIVVGKIELESAVDKLLAEFSESFIQNVSAGDSGWFLSLGVFIVSPPPRHNR